MLTQAELKINLHYDCGTGIFTWLIATSQRVKAGSIAGSKRSDGYLAIKLNGKSYKAHRLAWLYINGVWPQNQIDHINNIKDDNSIANLREATQEQNQQNHRQAHSDNPSGLLGVSWNKAMQKWLSQIQVNKKMIHIGLFACKFEAHEAYLAKKRDIHEFCTI